MGRKLEPIHCEIVRELGFDKCEFIGGGGAGVAIDVGNNKVMKITTSYDEYDMVESVIGKKIKGLVQYHARYETGKRVSFGPFHEDLYAILMDKAIPLSKKDFNLLHTSIDYLMDKWFVSSNNNPLMTHLLDQLNNKTILGSKLWDDVYTKIKDTIPNKDHTRAMRLFALYLKSMQSLESQDILHWDPHAGNVGWDPYDRFVFFDYS